MRVSRVSENEGTDRPEATYHAEVNMDPVGTLVPPSDQYQLRDRLSESEDDENWPTYSASKGGLTMLTYSLARGLADHEIRVNAIHPGSIETEIAVDQAISPEQVAALLEKSPPGWDGQPTEIGGAAVFLASELASYATGESLAVDGGWTCWR